MKEWFLNNLLGLVGIVATILCWIFYYVRIWLKGSKQRKADKIVKQKEHAMKDDLALVAQLEKRIIDLKNKWGVYDKEKESNVKA